MSAADPRDESSDAGASSPDAGPSGLASPADGETSDAASSADATAWMLTDSLVGWQDRARAAELVREHHERMLAAQAQTAAARAELARLRARRSVRVALELTAAGRRATGPLPERLRSALSAEPAVVELLPEPPPAMAPEADERPRPPRRVRFDQPHVRVAHLGRTARYAAVAPHTVLRTASWRQTLAEGHDLVLLEAGPGRRLPRLTPEVARRARELGIPVVLLADDPDPDLVPLADLVFDAPPSIDRRVFNPIGWSPEPPLPLLAVVTTPTPDPGALTALASLDPPVTLAFGPDVPAGLVAPGSGEQHRYRTPRELARLLRRTGVLVDHGGLHRSPLASERVRVAASACGALVASIDDRELDAAIVSGPPSEAVPVLHDYLTDVDRRERRSITARRTTLLTRTHAAGFRVLLDVLDIPAVAEPLVTVLAATNRPDQLAHLLRAAARQRHPRRETVLVLHGDGFDDPLPRIPGLGALEVIRVGGHRVLGEVLNAGIDQAAGAYVAKLDDDDHYGAWHVTDLVVAHGYSEADLVGKRIDFFHLAGAGPDPQAVSADPYAPSPDAEMTVRRSRTTPERYRPRVSGASMLLPIDTARRYRFLRLPRAVDSTLCDRIVADGGRIYQTHSRDIIATRRAGGHTWDVDEGRLLEEAVGRRPGLDVVYASSEPLDETATTD